MATGTAQATVIPLRPNATSSDTRRRADDMRRHPSTQFRRGNAAERSDGLVLVREDDALPKGEAATRGAEELNALASRICGVAEFVRRRLTGDYSVDEFGYDPHFTDAIVIPALRTLLTSWFRVEVRGIENLPETGAALIVANHAGTLPLDGLMATVAVRDRHPAHRALRLLAADMVFDNPVLGPLARKAGHTLACSRDAHRLLSAGELTAVFPEGYKGLGKRFNDRYKLQRFGRGGFATAAVRTSAPIIPCSIVGSEEIYPMIGELTPLARLLGLPYFPITPLFPIAGPLGLIPLPSKWYIEFGTPISTAGFDDSAYEDPMITLELTDKVRETIQRNLYRVLSNRRNVFRG
jgi:1-acyl-sn-glycerol-3-phosphate acyltransferase